MLDTRSKRGTDISSDHQLVSKIKLKLKTNISKSIKRIQFDLQKLKQKKWQEEFEKELHNKSRKIENSNNKETIEELWENFKTAYIETTQNKGGITEDTIQSINERRNVKQKINATKSQRIVEKLRKEYSEIDKSRKNADETKEKISTN